MKTIATLTLLICTIASYSQSFMTYNIRFDNPNDGINKWELRKKNIVDIIREYFPDVFGTQEGLSHQVDFLDKNFNYYSFVGVGRDDGKKKGEHCAIFYKNNDYKVLQEDTFWLSSTPGKVSVGWDAVLERICTYALFKNKKTGKKFWVFNAHFDHVGKEAQYESTKLILNKIKKLNKKNYSVILLGDLNLLPASDAIQLLGEKMVDSHTYVKMDNDIGTYNAFKHNLPVTDRIDYIFVDKSAKILSYQIIEIKDDGRYPSDHLPVLVKIGK